MKHRQSKNNLDEMQDSKLFKIEETGLWLSFWGLMAAIIIQFVIGTTLKEIAGEIFVLAIQSIYIAFSTIRNGLWTRSYMPTKKTNFIFSFIPALIIGGIHAVRQFLILHEQIHPMSILVILLVMVVVYVLFFAIFEGMRALYQKRRDKLEDVDDERKR